MPLKLLLHELPEVLVVQLGHRKPLPEALVAVHHEGAVDRHPERNVRHAHDFQQGRQLGPGDHLVRSSELARSVPSVLWLPVDPEAATAQSGVLGVVS